MWVLVPAPRSARCLGHAWLVRNNWVADGTKQPLERFHADVALQLLEGVPELTAHLPPSVSARLKGILTELILSTSLETQFEFMERVRVAASVLRLPRRFRSAVDVRPAAGYEYAVNARVWPNR
jgi:hypothetical protein